MEVRAIILSRRPINQFKKRISPWVKKKLNEIIGEDEPTLITFITDKLSSESKPEQILSEIQVVLGT